MLLGSCRTFPSRESLTRPPALVAAQNNPLYVQRLDGEPGLDLHFVVHSSLDALEERAADASPDEPLCSVEEYAVYGMVTATNIKVVLVLDAEPERAPLHGSARAFLQALYSLYVDCASNPFFKMDSALDVDSPVDGTRDLAASFEKKVATLVRSHQGALGGAVAGRR